MSVAPHCPARGSGERTHCESNRTPLSWVAERCDARRRAQVLYMTRTSRNAWQSLQMKERDSRVSEVGESELASAGNGLLEVGVVVGEKKGRGDCL